MPSDQTVQAQYDIGRETILYQSELARELSDRAFNLLNLGIAVMAALALAINFRFERLEWDTPLITVSGLALAVFGVLLALAIPAMNIRKWNAFPKLSEMVSDAQGRYSVVVFWADAIKENDEILGAVREAVSAALLFLVLEIAVAAALMGLVYAQPIPPLTACQEVVCVAGLVGL